jgi:hypothetical protein
MLASSSMSTACGHRAAPIGGRPVPRMAHASVWRVEHAPRGLRTHAAATSIDEALSVHAMPEEEPTTSPVAVVSEGVPQDSKVAAPGTRSGVGRGHQQRQRPWKGPQGQQTSSTSGRQGEAGVQQQQQQRVTTGPKPPAVINISHAQNIGSAAAFIKRVCVHAHAAAAAGTSVRCMRAWAGSTLRACSAPPHSPLMLTAHAARCAQTIMGEGAAMVACNGDAALWQAFRALRCARSMLIEVGRRDA